MEAAAQRAAKETPELLVRWDPKDSKDRKGRKGHKDRKDKKARRVHLA